MPVLQPVLFAYILCFSLAHGVPGFIPLLPVLKIEYSLTTMEVSNCLAYFSYAALIATPFAGYLYSKLNKRIFILLINILYMGGLVGVYFAPSYNFLVFSRVVQGIGSAGLCILMPLLPAEFYQGAERVNVMGKCNAAMAIGVTTLPPLSGYLANISWHYSILALIMPTLITLTLFIFTDFTSRYETEKAKVSAESIKNVLKTPGIINLCLCLCLVSGIDLAMPSTFSLYSSEKLGFTPDTIGKIYAAGYTGMIIASTFLLTRLIKQKYFAYILLLHGSAAATGMCIFTFIPDYGIFLVFFIFYLLSGIVIPFTNYSIANMLNPSLLAIGLTISSTFFRAGQGLITAFFAYIKTEWGDACAFAGIGIVFSLIVLTLFRFIVKYHGKNTINE